MVINYGGRVDESMEVGKTFYWAILHILLSVVFLRIGVCSLAKILRKIP